jgi:hypothetical protein
MVKNFTPNGVQETALYAMPEAILGFAAVPDDKTKLVDVDPPTLQAISLSRPPSVWSDTFIRGEIIFVTLTFSEPVLFFGSMELQIAIGEEGQETIRSALCMGSAEEDNYIVTTQCSYTVAEDDVDLDGVDLDGVTR